MSSQIQNGNKFRFSCYSLPMFLVKILTKICKTSADDSENCIKKTRKRTRNPEQVKSAKMKRKVQKGEEHTTKSGITIEQKVFRAQTTCFCTHKCFDRIDSSRQKQIFDTFYELENWSKKTLFLRTLVKTQSVKVNWNPIISQKEKTVSNKYHLYDSFGNQQQVCLKFLLNCLQISKHKMCNVYKSVISNETAKDNRGNFPTRKTDDEDVTFVKDFISKLPTYESHYKLSQSNIKYLSPFWNIIRLYREYCIKCQFEKRKPVSEWKFREIFNTQFNLSFARLKVDTCRKCDELNALSQSLNPNSKERADIEEQKIAHLNLVQKIKEEFKETIEYASDRNNKTVVLTFDLQRALEVPVIQTSEAFYLRQLWCYNLGIYDEVTKTGYMYVWNESIASRGSQEVSSCLYKHFEKYVPKDTQKIILRSDTCTGQNRNIKMALMLKKVFSQFDFPELTSIEQHFFVSGHSYNKCDSSFSLIEKQKQVTENILLPKHWVNLMRVAKKTEPTFVVTEMFKEDFYSSAELEALVTNRKKNTTGQKISWLNMQKIVYERYSPFLLDILEYGSSSTMTISLQKRRSQGDFDSTKLTPLFVESREIAFKKYKDLQKLLKYIPAKYHGFYRGLKHDQNESTPDYEFADYDFSNEDDYLLLDGEE